MVTTYGMMLPVMVCPVPLRDKHRPLSSPPPPWFSFGSHPSLARHMAFRLGPAGPLAHRPLRAPGRRLAASLVCHSLGPRYSLPPLWGLQRFCCCAPQGTAVFYFYHYTTQIQSYSFILRFASWRSLHRHTQKCVCIVILNSVAFAININLHA